MPVNHPQTHMQGADIQGQDLPMPTLTRTVTDDTLPGGPYEKTIEYIPPFDKCEREEDYETVWAEFERRLHQNDI